jgi:hypothetical protein
VTSDSGSHRSWEDDGYLFTKEGRIIWVSDTSSSTITAHTLSISRWNSPPNPLKIPSTSRKPANGTSQSSPSSTHSPQAGTWAHTLSENQVWSGIPADRILKPLRDWVRVRDFSDGAFEWFGGVWEEAALCGDGDLVLAVLLSHRKVSRASRLNASQ